MIVFSKDWYLDAVCGDANWDVSLVEKNNEIVASLPYYITHRYGFKHITMPPATQNLGPYIKYPKNMSDWRSFSWEKELFFKLLEGVPAYASFNQRLPYTIINVLPFLWKDFSVGCSSTYILSPENNSLLDRGIQADTVRRIKKCRSAGVKIIQSDEYNKLYQLVVGTFIRKGMRTSYTQGFIERIFSVLQLHNSCRLNFAVLDGEYIAASLLVFDSKTVYYLMGGISPSHKELGAQAYNLYENIQFAFRQNKIFDFEGGGNEATNRFFRSFGALQKNYFILNKEDSRLYKSLKFIKHLL